jgi:hypothetical protein
VTPPSWSSAGGSAWPYLSSSLPLPREAAAGPDLQGRGGEELHARWWRCCARCMNGDRVGVGETNPAEAEQRVPATSARRCSSTWRRSRSGSVGRRCHVRGPSICPSPVQILCSPAPGRRIDQRADTSAHHLDADRVGVGRRRGDVTEKHRRWCGSQLPLDAGGDARFCWSANSFAR